jgi:hypothetical protein
MSGKTGGCHPERRRRRAAFIFLVFLSVVEEWHQGKRTQKTYFRKTSIKGFNPANPSSNPMIRGYSF